jgi:glycerol-3-phosphate acyltransferase PlsY
VALLLITRIISISSLAATTTVFIVSVIIPPLEGNHLVVLLITFIMCLIVFVKHKDNIVRLLKGQEKPIFGKKGEK